MLSDLLKDRPKITSTFIFILFVTTVASGLSLQFSDFIILDSSALNTPQKWYQFITYSLAINGLFNWFVYSLVLFLFGKVTEKYLKTWELVLMMITSAIIGGIAVIIFSGTKFPIRLASPGFIGWGMSSAVIIFGFRNWHQSESLERATVILCFILIVWQIATFNPPIFFAQCIVMAISALWVSIRYKKKTSKLPDIDAFGK